MAAHELDGLEERLLHRMIFFTDAVFAIVLTVLVLELKPPHGTTSEQLRQLGAMANELVAFATSFAIIGIFWVAHMNSTRRLVRFDWAVAIANLLFLFPICLVPFVTDWGFESELGWGVYCALMVAISAANMLLSAVATRGGGRLEGLALTRRERLIRISRGAAPGFAFGTGLILLLAGQFRLAQLCGALIPLFIWGRARVLGRESPRPPKAAAGET